MELSPRNLSMSDHFSSQRKPKSDIYDEPIYEMQEYSDFKKLSS